MLQSLLTIFLLDARYQQGWDMRPSYWRKRNREVNGEDEYWDNVEELKKLRLEDVTEGRQKDPPTEEHGLQKSKDNPCPSKALIPFQISPTEESFKLTMLADFPDTTLGRLLLRQTEVDANNSLDDDSTGRELILYQPDPLCELLKAAAYIEEHQMCP